MDRFDRIFELHKLLSSSRHPVPRRKIEERLECSKATVKRIISNMRLFLNAPIEYDAERGGYYYDPQGGGMYQLPGVWFNASELFALLSVDQLLAEVQPGLLEPQLGPLRERIGDLLRAQHAGSEEIPRRIRIRSAAARPGSEFFQHIAGALAERRRLALRFYNRRDDREIERTVSPQRLIHYRDNWYLDAWCHLRDGFRTFSLDAVRDARPLSEGCVEFPEPELEAYYSSAYGIFSGPPENLAVLRFTAERARWVSAERWHPAQQSRWLEDGRYELRVPFSKPPELIMDILKYGADVEVMAPPELRAEVAQRQRAALALYEPS